METLGSLCDKLTIVKLKQYHSDESNRLRSLSKQERQLINEIDQYIANVLIGNIPIEKLTFDSNKVYKKEGNEISRFAGNIGESFSELAKINTELWHQQEKVYEFEKVPMSQKDFIVKELAVLNLKRNQCIDLIDKNLSKLIVKSKNNV